MSFNSRTISFPPNAISSTSPTSTSYFASRHAPIATIGTASPSLQHSPAHSNRHHSPPSSSNSTALGTPIPIHSSSTSTSSKRTSTGSVSRSREEVGTSYGYDDKEIISSINSSFGTNKGWSRREIEDEEEEDGEMDLDEDGDSGEGGSGGGDSRDSNSSSSKSARDRKRSRTLTTSHQTAVLNALLNKTRFPSTETREDIGQQIGMSARRVQIWFQNRRQSQKRVRDRDVTQPSPPNTASYSNDNRYTSSSSTQARDYTSNGDSRYQHRPLIVHHPTGQEPYNSRDSYGRQNLPNGVVMSTEEAHSRRLYPTSTSREGGVRPQFNFNGFEERLAASTSSRWTVETLPYPPPHYHSRSPSASSPPILPPIRSNTGTSPSPPNTGVSTSSTSSSTTSSIREFGIKLPPISAMFSGGTSPHLQLAPLPSPHFQSPFEQYRQAKEPLESPAVSFTSDRSSRGILSPDCNQYDEEDPFSYLPSQHQQKRHDSTTTITQSTRYKHDNPESTASTHSSSQGSRSQSREIELDLEIHSGASSHSSSSAQEYSNSNSSSRGERFRSSSMESAPPTRDSSSSHLLAPISSMRDNNHLTSPPSHLLPLNVSTERLPRLAALALYSPSDETFPTTSRNSALFGNYFDSLTSTTINLSNSSAVSALADKSTTSICTATSASSTSNFSIPTSSTRSSIGSTNTEDYKRCSTGATSITSSVGDPIEDNLIGEMKTGEVVTELDTPFKKELVY